MSTIKKIERCQPAGIYVQGSTFSPGEYIPDENKNKFIVTLTNDETHTITRENVLPLCGKNPSQHVTQKDLEGLIGKEIDSTIFDG